MNWQKDKKENGQNSEQQKGESQKEDVEEAGEKESVSKCACVYVIKGWMGGTCYHCYKVSEELLDLWGF